MNIIYACVHATALLPTSPAFELLAVTNLDRAVSGHRANGIKYEDIRLGRADLITVVAWEPLVEYCRQNGVIVRICE